LDGKQSNRKHETCPIGEEKKHTPENHSTGKYLAVYNLDKFHM